jgi:hypothetical protein
VPYDYLQPMIFQGEEMSIGIRGFTVGYDFYAPERSVCFHHYATGANAAKRNRVKKFWENGDRYRGTGKKAMARLLGIGKRRFIPLVCLCKHDVSPHFCFTLLFSCSAYESRGGPEGMGSHGH